jgi:hypothetical protein
VVDSNKILTVSYGTFSCTLEGFDDAFETMKAIAEYFRDLAADDRFFGAEPPTPDAEMMARIAERGSARRVEARASDDGIVLRSGAAAPALPAAAAPAPRKETPAAPVQDAAEDEAPEDDFAEEDMPPAAARGPAALPMADEDSIVAKLRRIRSVVSRNGATTAGDYAEDQDIYEAPRAAGLDASALYEATVTPEATEEAALAELEDEISAAEARDAQPGDMAGDEDLSETAEDEGAAVSFQDEAEEETAAAEEETAGDEAFEEVEAFEDGYEDEDTVAEDAAFEEEEDAAFEEDAFDEGEEAAFEDTDEADAFEEEEAAFEDTDEADAFEEATFEEAAFDDDEADASAEDAPVAENTRHQSDMDHDDDEEHHHRTFPVAAATAAAAATGWPRVVKVKRRDMEAVAARNPAVAAASGLSAEQEAELQNELAELEAEMAAEARAIPAEDAYEEDIEPAEARHVELDENDADADYAGTEAEPAHAADEAWDEDDDEAAWEEALAEDDDIPAEAAELAGQETYFEDDENAAEAPAEMPQAPTAPAGRAKLDASANPGDMDRILAETNNQLHETEGTRRRSAIQHLRAAVAATKAEQQAGSDLGAGKDEDHTNAYREDLAQVVRPRRPRSGGTTGRRTEDKPAPLRLVAEQRVDIEAEHRAPVRPRRVSIADLIRQEADDEEDAVQPDTAKGEGFPAFLEDSGAEELSEVLEAAASYLAFVEGREQFSRPQLMNRVREVDPDGYSREDALRAFGSLLREGKIRKVKGGRFAASDRIGFRPDQRAVG